MTDQQLLVDKQTSPEKYLKQKERFPWPTEYTGSLLAWLAYNMASHNNEKIYSPGDIEYVDCYDDDGSGDTRAYEFDTKAFDIEFTSNGGIISQIEGRIYRFVMNDSALFIVLPQQGHQSTRLSFMEPTTRPSSLSKGLSNVLNRK